MSYKLFDPTQPIGEALQQAIKKWWWPAERRGRAFFKICLKTTWVYCMCVIYY